jgi:L-rhamnose mutarotase
MTKNEIIDAVLACKDREGVTPYGVFIDKLAALFAVLPGQKDVEPKVKPVLTEEVQPQGGGVMKELVDQGFEPAVVTE